MKGYLTKDSAVIIYKNLIRKPIVKGSLKLFKMLFIMSKRKLQYTSFMLLNIRPRLNQNSINQHLKSSLWLNHGREIIDLRALIHVTFHLDRGRVAYLSEAVRQLDRLKFFSKEIVVDSNAEESIELLRRLDLPGKVSVDKNLYHPFRLAWSHRESMKKRVDEFDVFIYVEDDIYIPDSTLAYWYKEKEKLKRHGYLPGFLRVEHNRKNRLVSSDFEHPASKDSIVEIDGARYLATPFPYQACWVYDKQTMIEFIGCDAFENGWTNFAEPAYIRENAAIGLAYESPPEGNSSRYLLALNDDGMVSAETFVFHIPSNYGRRLRPQSAGLGTIPVERLIAANG
jgi:hypothetical protein